MPRATATRWANRIVGTADVAPAELLANPANFRRHPKHQAEALEGVLGEVGWLQQVIVNKRTGHLIDGHLRVSLAVDRKEPTVPVVYVDLDEAQERLALATFDSITGLAETDAGQLEALLRDVTTGDAAIQALLDGLAQSAGLVPPTDPTAEWQGMPEFEQEDRLGGTALQLIVHFKTLQDKAAFGNVIGQPLTEQTKYVWYPEQERSERQSLQWADES